MLASSPQKNLENKNGIRAATIRIGQEIQCLPNAGFFLISSYIKLILNVTMLVNKTVIYVLPHNLAPIYNVTLQYGDLQQCNYSRPAHTTHHYQQLIYLPD